MMFCLFYTKMHSAQRLFLFCAGLSWIRFSLVSPLFVGLVGRCRVFVRGFFMFVVYAAVVVLPMVVFSYSGGLYAYSGD